MTGGQPAFLHRATGRASGLAALIAVSVASPFGPIGAQSARQAPPPMQCPAVTVDTVIGPVYGILLVEPASATVPDGLLARTLDALTVALISDTLELAPVSALNDIVITAITSRRSGGETLAPWWPGHPSLTTELGFSIEPSGAFSNPKLHVRGDSVTAAVLLRGLARVRALDQPLPPSAVRVRLRLSVSPESMEAAAPLVAVRLLRTSARIGRMVPEGSPTPRYPPWAKGRNLGAAVLVWYVLDERGHVVRRTIGATSAARPTDDSHYESFVKAVTDVTPSWMHDREWVPECAGRRQVLVRVEFNIGRQ